MKRLIFIACMLFFGAACTPEYGQRNPYLQEVRFSVELNLNLPAYAPLQQVGNPVLITAPGVGTQGVYVINTGFDQFRAFEAACPNHTPNTCSLLTLSGQNGVCSCEGYTYTLFTGQMLQRPNDGKRYYDLLSYQAALYGNTLRVFQP